MFYKFYSPEIDPKSCIKYSVHEIPSDSPDYCKDTHFYKLLNIGCDDNAAVWAGRDGKYRVVMSGEYLLKTTGEYVMRETLDTLEKALYYIEMYLPIRLYEPRA